MYRNRVIETKLREYIDFFSVVGLTGPRQSGKSTLLLETLQEYKYISFDDINYMNAIKSDPKKFMRVNNNKIIFDEAQKVPELFEHIKLLVDQDRQTVGKFIITGSSQFTLMNAVSESLAGRIGLLTLLPYQFQELTNQEKNISKFMGSYPEIVEKKHSLVKDWYSSYIDTYIQKDVRGLLNIGDLSDFTRLIYLLATNVAEQFNMSKLASDLGISVNTIKRWISVLEASYIIFLLPPFYNNFGKRIIKRPKLYFYDTGLVSYLLGLLSVDLENNPLSGKLFENYIISEVYKKELHSCSNDKLYYFRSSHGVEVDLIIDRKSYIELLEIKQSETYRPKMVKSMESIAKEVDKLYLVYGGETINVSSTVNVINYQDYLGI